MNDLKAHELPDFFTLPEWRSWKKLFSRQIVSAVSEFFAQDQTKRGSSVRKPSNFIYLFRQSIFDYSRNCEKASVYIVFVQGVFEWGYRVPELSPPADQPWRKWRNEYTIRDLQFYKYGVTKHSNVLKRNAKHYRRVVDSCEVPMHLASYVEKAIMSKIRLRFPRSCNSSSSSRRYVDTLDGLTTAFAGATETFTFCGSDSRLSGLTASIHSRVHSIYELAGDEGLWLYSSAAYWLEIAIVEIVLNRLLQFSPEHRTITWGSNEMLDYFEYCPDIGNGEIEWALKKVSDVSFHQTCLPFLEQKANLLNLSSLYCDHFIEKLAGLANDSPA